jgi:leader peptidase (prepilin peptidase)/N-methyltransferase
MDMFLLMTSRESLPLIILAAAIGGVSWTVFDGALAAVSCLLGWAMLAIAVSDFQRFIVPDILSLPAIPAGLIASGWLAAGEPGPSIVLEHLGAAVIGAASLYGVRELYRRARGREGLGLGDVKLAAVAGSWTGFQGLSPTLLLACVLAIAYVAARQSLRPHEVSGATAIPFGTFLAPSIWVIWCAGFSL